MLKKSILGNRESQKNHGRNEDKDLHQLSYTTNEINAQIKQVYPGEASLETNMGATLG